MAKRLWSDRAAGPVPELVTCSDEGAQAEAMCDRILERREEGIPLIDQCVLFRTGHHSAGLELELGRRDIPFVKFGGLRFLEAAHIKDVVAFLRMLDNPHDEMAWHRVLRLIPGIGPARARRIFGHVDLVSDDAIARFAATDLEVAPEARPALRELQSVLRDIGESDEPAGVQIDRIVVFCELTFPDVYEDPGVRLGDIERLATLARAAPTRATFIADLILDPPASTLVACRSSASRRRLSRPQHHPLGQGR